MLHKEGKYPASARSDDFLSGPWARNYAAPPPRALRDLGIGRHVGAGTDDVGHAGRGDAGELLDVDGRRGRLRGAEVVGRVVGVEEGGRADQAEADDGAGVEVVVEMRTGAGMGTGAAAAVRCRDAGRNGQRQAEQRGHPQLHFHPTGGTAPRGCRFSMETVGYIFASR